MLLIFVTTLWIGWVPLCGSPTLCLVAEITHAFAYAMLANVQLTGQSKLHGQAHRSCVRGPQKGMKGHLRIWALEPKYMCKNHV